MAVTFECRFAIAGSISPDLLPAIPISIPTDEGDRVSVRELFYFASGGVVKLQPDYQKLSEPAYEPQAASVSAGDLHNLLPALTQNPPNCCPLPRLGIILANIYAAKGQVFGVMFDTGAIDSDAPNSAVSCNPRGGCALFLQAIKQQRPDDRDYKNQVAFDLAHELGHIFNLQHVDAPESCFMNVSSLESPPPSAAFKFLSGQRSALAECETDTSITPGGKPFGSGGVGRFDAATRRSRSSALAFKIAMDQREFWTWEPVELELTISVNKTITIPDKLDPGYESFVIWIEEPSGERRRYRPPHYYCAYPAGLKLSPEKRFERDIPIFLEAGGYTFQEPGVHRIWVIFRISITHQIKSNVLEVLVRSRRGLSLRTRNSLDKMRRLQTAASRILFYKSGRSGRRETNALLELVAQHSRTFAGAAAQYALGRLYLDKRRRRPAQGAHWNSRARSYLETAREHPRLSGHKRLKAGELLAIS
jgi:predicted Zn-dependent protease